MTGSILLTKSIVAAWDSSGIHDAFLAYRASGSLVMPSIFDSPEAAHKTPMPYCVVEVGEGDVMNRMTKTRGDESYQRREVRTIPALFRIHANQASGQSGKIVAATLAGQVMRQFGGSSQRALIHVTMEEGAILSKRYVTDFSSKEGDSEWLHVIRYEFWVDTPVAN